MCCRRLHISTAHTVIFPSSLFLPPNFTLSKGDIIHIPNCSFKEVWGMLPNASPRCLSQPWAHPMSYTMLPQPQHQLRRPSGALHPHPGPPPCAPQAPLPAGTLMKLPGICLSPQLTQSKPLEDRECSYLVQGHIPYFSAWKDPSGLEDSKPTQHGGKNQYVGEWGVGESQAI